MSNGSPYSRKGKKPHKYSPLFYKLQQARAEGRTEEAEQLANAHSRVYGLRVRFSLNSIKPDDDNVISRPRKNEDE